MSWYNSYYRNLPVDSSIFEAYLDEFKIEDKVENPLEKEYENFINFVENYNLSNISNLNSMVLLENENNIIKLLGKYILQNNYLNYNFFIKCIDILCELSKILMSRLGQQNINHKTKNTNNYIPRCSYKFCNFKEECFYNYNIKTKNVCYQDHYVHNMVLADLIILKEYIKDKFLGNNLVIPNKEILKTINTLCFVIEHMYNELKSRCLYLNENQIEKEHFIKKLI
tara:strand:+ start:380 stop:1057 length:678 start_codon:yes stop_codon:yes gene_type:complete